MPERDVIERAAAAYSQATIDIQLGEGEKPAMKAAIRVVLADMDRWQQETVEWSWRAATYAREELGIELETEGDET